MKAIRKLLVVVVLAVSAEKSPAYDYTVLHSFSGLSSSNSTNVDGARPIAGLTMSGDTLFGVASMGGDGGGIYGSGTIFKVNTDGSGFTILKSFPGAPGGVNHDGASPQADLIVAGEMIYGVTISGGTNQFGTIYRISTNGTDFSVLRQGAIGENAGFFSGLILDGITLYGTSISGGIFTNGSVFRINTSGETSAILKSFPPATPNEFGFLTNSDGAGPESKLTLEGGVLYGLTPSGGTGGVGTIFKVETNGNNFAVLKTFSTLPTNSPRTNIDGANPMGGLIYSENVLYGTTRLGGTNALGTVFKLNTDGTGFTVLKHFVAADGVTPYAGLAVHGNFLYGTARSGGEAGNGVVYRLRKDGNGYAVLKHFSQGAGFTNYDGAKPRSGLVVKSGVLYGTTQLGGNAANGTVYKLDLRSPLEWQKTENQVVLSWTNSGLNLQAASEPNGIYTNISGASSPFTNQTTSGQQFFRLSSD